MRGGILLAWVVLASCGRGGTERAAAESAGASRANTQNPTPDRRGSRRVLFIGTSLTAGLGLDPDSAYPQLVQQKIDSAGLGYVVENVGVSGETTADLVGRIDWLMRGACDVVVLETGANDGLRGLPVANTRENLRRIIGTIARTHPNARLVVVQMEAPPNFGKDYTAAFHAMFPAVARESGATLMPFLLEGVAGRRELNQGDGIHPNMRGEHIVAATVWRTLEPVLREAAGTSSATVGAGSGGRAAAGERSLDRGAVTG